MKRRQDTNEDYTTGLLSEIYGTYHDRILEYRHAVHIGFHYGVLKINVPVLDVGCRNPYEGMLKMLRDFAWTGKYVGIDIDPPDEALTLSKDDSKADVHKIDVDGAVLPFPPTQEKPIKLFACAFLIETLEHIDERVMLLEELQRVSASVVVIAPNSAFTGTMPAEAEPFHKAAISAEDLQVCGFQTVGHRNFNGRKDDGTMFKWDSEKPLECSEVWGVWVDDIALGKGYLKKRPIRECFMDDKQELHGDPSAAPRIIATDMKGNPLKGRAGR